MTRTTIETHPTGTLFDFANPRAEDVHIEDIACALSMTCRFGGHVDRFYSVAEHACLVSRLIREAGGSAELQFAALHHDSHEAYVGDAPTPLKRYLGEGFEDVVLGIDYCIAERFDILVPDLRYGAGIKAADEQALAIEASYLKRSRGVGWTVDTERPHGAVACWDAAWAEHMFLMRHRELSSAIALQRLGLS